jgi:hypothetical protein
MSKAKLERERYAQLRTIWIVERERDVAPAIELSCVAHGEPEKFSAHHSDDRQAPPSGAPIPSSGRLYRIFAAAREGWRIRLRTTSSFQADLGAMRGVEQTSLSC